MSKEFTKQKLHKISEKFILINNDLIYKKRKNDWLCMTPFEGDRRASLNDLFNKYEKISPLNSKTAARLINKIWDNHEEQWLYNKALYKVTKNLNFFDAPEHEDQHRSTSIVYHHGRIYEAYLWEDSCFCKSIDNKPHECKWLDPKHLKPIYKLFNTKWKLI